MANRLTLLDASFLTMEGTANPMHSGGLYIFEPGLGYAQVLRLLQERIDQVPLGRKRVRQTAMGAGRPVWADDPNFDLTYHLRHAALPAPGDEGQLGEFVSRLIGRPLDRHRPLWELYVIEGLEGDRTCVFRKVHLAMTEEGPDPFGVLLDDRPQDPPAATRGDRWEPTPAPRTWSLAMEAARERAVQVGAVTRGARQVVSQPARLVDVAGAAAGSALGLAGRLLRQPPESPLNRRLTPHRRFALFRADLEDFRRVRRAFGSSINDVVVAVCGDAVGRLLRWRGHDTKDLDLRVMVPVRVHGDGSDPGALGEPPTVGEGVVGVLAPLPVMEMDAVARLYRIMGEMSGLKESRQAVAADNLVRLAGYAPPNLHAMAARVVSAEARYNVALSNAPGPQTPRWLAGTRMTETYPFIPLTGNCMLSMAVSSYMGQVFFGLLGDRSGMPDLETLSLFVGEALADLVQAAGAQGG
jgi:diacylglycerol O-acyltransferase / wax synthase